jgi:hypothetical protein
VVDVQVTSGMCAAESAQLMRQFFRGRRRQKDLRQLSQECWAALYSQSINVGGDVLTV